MSPRHYRWLIGRFLAEYPFGLVWIVARREAEAACGVTAAQAAAGLKSLRSDAVLEEHGGQLFLAWAAQKALTVLGIEPAIIMAEACNG